MYTYYTYWILHSVCRQLFFFHPGNAEISNLFKCKNPEHECCATKSQIREVLSENSTEPLLSNRNDTYVSDTLRPYNSHFTTSACEFVLTYTLSINIMSINIFYLFAPLLCCWKRRHNDARDYHRANQDTSLQQVRLRRKGYIAWANSSEKRQRGPRGGRRGCRCQRVVLASCADQLVESIPLRRCLDRHSVGTNSCPLRYKVIIFFF